MLLILTIAISLSMDTFSLALAYGTNNIPKKNSYLLALTVGIFHFFMPLIGLYLGSYILNFIKIDPNIIAGLILIFIGFQMTFPNTEAEKDINKFKILDYLLFAFAVSIDSFSVGITLNMVSQNYLFSLISFAICSFSFTLFGLLIGNKVQKSLGKISTLIGGVILIIIGLTYII